MQIVGVFHSIPVVEHIEKVVDEFGPEVKYFQSQSLTVSFIKPAVLSKSSQNETVHTDETLILLFVKRTASKEHIKRWTNLNVDMSFRCLPACTHASLSGQKPSAQTGHGLR